MLYWYVFKDVMFCKEGSDCLLQHLKVGIK